MILVSKSILYLKNLKKFVRLLINKIYLIKKYFDHLIFNCPILITDRFTSKSKTSPLGSFQWINYNAEFEFNKNKSSNYIISSKFGVYSQFYTFVNNRSSLRHASFHYESQRAIDNSYKLISKKKDIEVSENCYLLNYNVNHFGHFLGEVLGNILYLSDNNNHFLKDKNYSFAILTPNEKWFKLIKKINPKVNFLNLNKFKDLTQRLTFKNSTVIQVCSAYQNLTLARHYIQRYFSENFKVYNNNSKKIYLSNPKNNRIINNKEFDDWLKVNDFQKINPLDYELEDLFLLIRDSKYLISDQGSIMLNISLIRITPSIVITTNYIKTKKDFIGGGIYNSTSYGLIYELHCNQENITHSSSSHPYSQKVRVSMSNLDKLLSNIYTA